MRKKEKRQLNYGRRISSRNVFFFFPFPVPPLICCPSFSPIPSSAVISILLHFVEQEKLESQAGINTSLEKIQMYVYLPDQMN